MIEILKYKGNNVIVTDRHTTQTKIIRDEWVSMWIETGKISEDEKDNLEVWETLSQKKCGCKKQWINYFDNRSGRYNRDYITDKRCEYHE